MSFTVRGQTRIPAGIQHRRIYDMRHTFATWAIEGGVRLSYLVTLMGTSVRELEDTYFRWLERTDDQLRAAFHEYDAAALGTGWALNPPYLAMRMKASNPCKSRVHDSARVSPLSARPCAEHH